MVWDLWCIEDLEEKDDLLDQLISDGGVCRTAPATPGLLMTTVFVEQPPASPSFANNIFIREGLVS